MNKQIFFRWICLIINLQVIFHRRLNWIILHNMIYHIINLKELFLRNCVKGIKVIEYLVLILRTLNFITVNKCWRMRRLIISVLILLLLAVASTSCYSSRKSQSELRGLMLQENLKLKRNRAFYSKHNMKTKREIYKKHKKNSR